MQQDRLIVGVGGHVVALSASDGTELWRTQLKGGDFVTVRSAGGRVFAGASGQLFCLDGETGQVLWRNKLKGLGLGLVSLGDAADDAAGAYRLAQKRAAAAAAGA